MPMPMPTPRNYRDHTSIFGIATTHIITRGKQGTTKERAAAATIFPRFNVATILAYQKPNRGAPHCSAIEIQQITTLDSSRHLTAFVPAKAYTPLRLVDHRFNTMQVQPCVQIPTSVCNRAALGIFDLGVMCGKRYNNPSFF